MKAVQLDKNTNDRRLAQRCNQEGLVSCFRLPRRLAEADDDALLASCIETGRLLLTFDRRIAEDHTTALAAGFPGVMILALEDTARHTITTKSAATLLATFKTEFPRWHDVPWLNSVVELQARFVSVWRVEKGALLRTGLIAREHVGWQEALLRLMESNAFDHGAGAPGG
ncbi:MAG TPA: hypothetical protein VMV69_22635 [Pirellulales bacterium]|nr:hypothetical protein [Pirellulales bacterium]